MSYLPVCLWSTVGSFLSVHFVITNLSYVSRTFASLSNLRQTWPLKLEIKDQRLLKVLLKHKVTKRELRFWFRYGQPKTWDKEDLQLIPLLEPLHVTLSFRAADLPSLILDLCEIFPWLVGVSVYDCCHSDQTHLFAFLKACPLKHLKLYWLQTRWFDWRELHAILRTKDLQTLSLQTHGGSDVSDSHLLLLQSSSLRCLNLSFASITHAGLQHLRCSLPQLSHLNLNYVRISPNMFSFLVDWKLPLVLATAPYSGLQQQQVKALVRDADVSHDQYSCDCQENL